MRRTGTVLLVVFMMAGVAIAQNTPLPSGNLLGAHNVSGRGCLSCHTSVTMPAHGGIIPAEAGAAPVETSLPPWGPTTVPPYGRTIAFGDGGRYVEVLPNNVSTLNREVNGILVCLSCHDGNLTTPSMMVGESFEQRIGLLPTTGYGLHPVPSLLGLDSGAFDGYTNDHPVGTAAIISPGDGLVWVNNTFTVTPGSPYAQFVTHYGWPALMPGHSSNPWGINSSGQPFLLCTTCHNQHGITAYTSTASSPIASDGGGRFYSTFFFVNAPYNPNPKGTANTNAGSATQFCRQCHFRYSNEGNNSNTVPTVLPGH